MTNDLTDVRTEEAKPCFALSKNEFYLISTYGGQVCSTYQHLRLIFPKYGNATDNGDFHGSTACANVKSKLEGHSKSIISLAFPLCLIYLFLLLRTIR